LASSRKTFIEGIGEVTLARRRGNRHMRLSISPAGQVRVSLPLWAPYSLALAFLQERLAWIERHRPPAGPLLKSGMPIGRHYQLLFIPTSSSTVRTRLNGSFIQISSGLDFASPAAQVRIVQAAERALKNEALEDLPPRTRQLAQAHGFKYRSLKIKRLTSRWGSCSSRGEISLSFYLVQLPPELVDYVILHELLHTKLMQHGPKFWATMAELDPRTPSHRHTLKRWRPHLLIQ